MGFARGSTHPTRSCAQRGRLEGWPGTPSKPKTFIDRPKSKIQYFCVPAHQGAFLETILKRGGNAVPAGPARNRALGRLLGLAGTIIRSSRGNCVGGPGGARLRGSRKLLGAHKAAWSAERRAVFLRQRNAGPRRKRGRYVDLTRRPRRSHPLGETEKRTMGGPAPAFSGRRSVGCAGYLTCELETPCPVRGGSAAQRRHPPPCGEGRERSERGGGRSGARRALNASQHPPPPRSPALRFGDRPSPQGGG